ncbi:hypothetical protein [Streptomyces sp. NPDC088760]|uniref:hypothetical protein n=1 Tax=Streptomyces sp. NPDC088760 TaxID=3365890 RepID=UPI003818A639
MSSRTWWVHALAPVTALAGAAAASDSPRTEEAATAVATATPRARYAGAVRRSMDKNGTAISP